MKEIFDTVSYRSSEITTKLYSTSFSFGIKALDGRNFINPSMQFMVLLD